MQIRRCHQTPRTPRRHVSENAAFDLFEQNVLVTEVETHVQTYTVKRVCAFCQQGILKTRQLAPQPRKRTATSSGSPQRTGPGPRDTTLSNSSTRYHMVLVQLFEKFKYRFVTGYTCLSVLCCFLKHAFRLSSTAFQRRHHVPADHGQAVEEEESSHASGLAAARERRYVWNETRGFDACSQPLHPATPSPFNKQKNGSYVCADFTIAKNIKLPV